MNENKFFVRTFIGILIGFALIIEFVKVTEVSSESINEQGNSPLEEIINSNNNTDTQIPYPNVSNSTEVNIPPLYDYAFTTKLVATISSKEMSLHDSSFKINTQDEITTEEEVVEHEAADPDVSSVSQDTQEEELSNYTYFDALWTSYDLCVECCGKTTDDPYYGVTASGYKITPGIGEKVIAVDSSLIPLGSKVYVEILDDNIEDYGYAIAADTGGAINGYHIDLYIDGHSGQWYGKGNARVYIIE